MVKSPSHEQGGQDRGGKGQKRVRGPRQEAHRDEGARERQDVERGPGASFVDGCARRGLEHEVLGDQRRHECRLPFFIVHHHRTKYPATRIRHDAQRPLHAREPELPRPRWTDRRRNAWTRQPAVSLPARERWSLSTTA
jgi:hypothetical protein